METTEQTRASGLRGAVDKVFGGIELTWPLVIGMAVGSAVITFCFLFFPVFEGTSFHRMGETMEAWVLFGVFLMANGKTPLDAALKTFVFFLVSQPLIYLFQVPFNWMGWGIFQYYPYWFGLTLLTFPAAFLGWHVRRRDWVALLILLPVIALLSFTAVEGLSFASRHFPRLLVTGLFCLAQILLYLYAFTSNVAQKAVGLLPLAAVLALSLTKAPVEIDGNQFLPNDPVLTEAATVEVADPEYASVVVSETGEDSMVHVWAHGYGQTSFTITDGEAEYRYNLRVYEDDAGYTQVEITEG